MQEDKNIDVEELKNGEVAYGNLNLLPKKEIKEMTVEEISKSLGYDVKIVKESDK